MTRPERSAPLLLALAALLAVAGNAAPSATVPDAPSIASVSVAGTNLVFVLNKPASNGGAPITRYEISAVLTTGPNGAGSVLFTAKPTAIAGKPNQVLVGTSLSKYLPGTSYFFSARAINSQGDGAVSSRVNSTVPFLAGTYTFSLKGRATCAVRGFATAFACGSGNRNVTMSATAVALSRFTLTPTSGTSVLNTPVSITSLGRDACGRVLQPDSLTNCGDADVAVKGTASAQWWIEPSGVGRYRIRALGRSSCDKEFLGGSPDCATTTLSMISRYISTKEWTFTRVD